MNSQEKHMAPNVVEIRTWEAPEQGIDIEALMQTQFEHVSEILERTHSEGWLHGTFVGFVAGCGVMFLIAVLSHYSLRWLLP